MKRNMRGNFPETFVLVKNGKFYRCFDEDSYIIAYLMNYQVKTTFVNDVAGFPVDSLRKVADRLIIQKVNYKVFTFEDGIAKLQEECNFKEANQYNEIYKKAERFVKIRDEISVVSDILNASIENEMIEETLTKIKNLIDQSL